MIHQGHPYWSAQYGHTVALEAAKIGPVKMLVYPKEIWPRVVYLDSHHLAAMPLRYLHDQLP